METTAPAAPMDVAELDDTAALLTANGIPFTRTEEALRCELSVAGKTYAIAYLIPAQGVFFNNPGHGTFSDAFEVIQERILGEEFFARTANSLYLLVIGETGLLFNQNIARAALEMEHNLSYGKKEVMSPEQAVEWLRRPFFHLAGAQRANATPFAATVADFRQEAQPTANYVLNVEEVLRDSTEHRHLVREQASSLYRRIMGAEHKVFWPDEGPALGRISEEEGTEATYCSSGERIVFAFSLFMARAMLDVKPGMCIGIHNSFDRLDSVRQIGAYDCLREFMTATGASVLVQSAKESLRTLVLHRLCPVVEALGGQATDYPIKYR